MADFYKNFDLIAQDSEDCRATGVQYSVASEAAFVEPVDAAFFKQHARIDFDTDDNLVEIYIAAARRALEQYTQKSFGIKTMRLRALYLPPNWRLMFGPVNAVTDPATGYTATGDILTEGYGANIDIQYTTLDTLGDQEDIQVAICRYAAGLYIFRENVVETKFAPQMLYDAAKEMVEPYRNITLFG